MKTSSESKPERKTPVAIALAAGVVLCGAGALLSLQACGDNAGPKPPTAPSSTASTPATGTPPTSPTHSPPPPT